MTGNNHYRASGKRQQRDLSQKPSDENILLVQSIQITDKFGFNQDDSKLTNSSENTDKIYTTSFHDESYSFTCLNGYGKFFKIPKAKTKQKQKPKSNSNQYKLCRK